MQLLSDSGLELEKALLIEQLYDRTPDDADLPESSATRILQTILGSQSNGVSAPAAEPLRDRVNLRSWLKVAAALVPLFLLGAYLWLNPGKGGGMADRAPEPAESMEKILPGGNRALLTLADGSVIVLDEACEG
ncbi:hypothetical protein AWW69_04705 [Bacillus cereus]|nr:hypothetical protein AWW69_04705 [Bacillus cereus]